MTWDGDNVIGRAKVLDTPMGRIAQGLLEGGVQLGVSTRGLGSLKTLQNGINEVQSDFVMNTVDIVGDPSAPDAFVNGIMEGTEYFMLDGKLVEQTVEDINRAAKAKKLNEAKKLDLFAKFILEISKK
jgi:hypothetical protein